MEERVSFDSTNPIHNLAICITKARELSMMPEHVVNSTTMSDNLASIVISAVNNASDAEKNRLWNSINAPKDKFDFNQENILFKEDKYNPELDSTNTADFSAQGEVVDDEDGQPSEEEDDEEEEYDDDEEEFDDEDEFDDDEEEDEEEDEESED